MVWCIQLLLYAQSYFRSTHGALFLQAMISPTLTFNVTTSWVFINLIKINCLDFIFWNCVLNSIIFAQIILWMSNYMLTQTHMWLSYKYIFLSCHMICKRDHIHLLYFSELRDLSSTLVDPMNLSWEQTTQEFLKDLLVFQSMSITQYAYLWDDQIFHAN